MEEGVRVRCKRPYDIETERFVHPLDQFRNALYLPPEAFAALGIDEYEYVRVAGTGERIVTAPLESAPELVDEDAYVGALRTTLLQDIADRGDGRVDSPTFVVTPDSTIEQFTARAGRTYDDEIDYRVCHIPRERMAALDLTPGTEVEVFNPTTGGRIDVTVGTPHDDEDLIRIDVRSRQALDLTPGDEIGFRTIELDVDDGTQLGERVLHQMVDSREMPFNVRLGPDQDEYRSIVRMTEDMMDFIGVEPGDNVVLEWRDETTRAQCLPTELDEDDPPNTIKVPSTQRDEITVSVHDAVTVERDMGYVFRKQMAVSMLGIFGVVFGALQTLSVLDLQQVLRRVGTVAVASGVVLSITLLSILVVWILLMPERQKCVSHE